LKTEATEITGRLDDVKAQGRPRMTSKSGTSATKGQYLLLKWEMLGKEDNWRGLSTC
jgi:hypothetical protein